MENNKFEIILVLNNTNDFFMSYEWYDIPNVGDLLALMESRTFKITKRLLPMDNSNRVVLFGVILKDNIYDN